MTLVRFLQTTTYRYYFNKFLSALVPPSAGITIQADFKNPKGQVNADFKNPKQQIKVDFQTVQEIN